MDRVLGSMEVVLGFLVMRERGSGDVEVLFTLRRKKGDVYKGQ